MLADRWNPRHYAQLAAFLEGLLAEAHDQYLTLQFPEDRIAETGRLIDDLKSWIQSHSDLVADQVAARLVQRSANVIVTGVSDSDPELLNILLTITEREIHDWPVQTDWEEYQSLITGFTEHDAHGAIVSTPTERAETLFSTSRAPHLPGARIAVSGRFAFGEQADVLRRVAELGATPQESVDESTSILVMGLTSAFADGTVYRTRKLDRALEMRDRGSAIEVVHESSVIEQLSAK